MRSAVARKKLSVDQALGSGETKYSDSMSFDRCVGNASVLFATTAGTTALSQQCSVDGLSFYDPVDNAGSALGVLAAAQGVTAGIYVSYSPILTPYIRFKYVHTVSTASTINLTLIFREEV